MEVRQVGRSDVHISRVGLGGVEVGPFAGEEPDVARAVDVLEAARAAGVNWVDTSENYLESANEALLGRALGALDDGFLVSTKVAPGAAISGGGSGFKRDEVHAACRASLRRLGRDHIDLYFLHWPDDKGVPLEETWGAMAELRGEGLVRAIGLSNYARADVERCHAQHPVDAVQDGLNLLDYFDNRESFARYGELGIAVTVFEPLASTVLTDRSREEALAAWETYAAHGWTSPHLAPERIDRTYAVVDNLRPIAQRLGATIAQIAIAWVLLQPGVTATLAGTRSPARIRENAGAAELHLTPADDEIEALIPLGPFA